MDTSVTRLRDIFLNEKELPKRALFAVFDRAGIPSDTCWRTLYRMIFDSKINFNPIAEKAVSRQQLVPVMNQALKNIELEDFSEKALLALIKNYNSAFVSVCQSELAEAVNELDSLTSEFRSICHERQDKVETLETDTLQTVRSDSSIEEKIRSIKAKFRATIELFQADVNKLDHISNTDHLTGLYNRRFFDEQIHAQADQAVSEKTWLNLLMIDIDNFKQFNDEYGHLIGDQALKTVAKNINLACSEESERTGIVYYPVRYGGEEFAVIVPAVDITEAEKTGEAIREKINGYTFVIRGKQGSIKHENIKLTVSVGVAGFPHKQGKKDGVEELIKNADKAMFTAKKTGKNRIMTHYR
ncbi:MAG: GGDEF domain-containing protein [Desulfarculaceae bacterium]|nr:GGDEF domain-containing protein [Desulfarculaceae bacterium]